MDEGFIAKSQSVFSSLPQHLKESSDFIKMFISVLMPYQSKDVHFETTISNSQIMGICQKHDFEALASNYIFKRNKEHRQHVPLHLHVLQEQDHGAGEVQEDPEHTGDSAAGHHHEGDPGAGSFII